jgi:hypothetical protein
LGFVAHYRGENAQAQDWAQRALEIALQTEHRRQQRRALRLLAHSLAGMGQCADATATYQQALDLDQSFGYPHLVFETMTDLARVALAQGDLYRAVAYVVTILDGLGNASPVGIEEPAQIYVTCYQVLKASQDPRAGALLASGYTVLTDWATKCSPARRSTFLECIPAHLTLQQLWNQEHARSEAVER